MSREIKEINDLLAKNFIIKVILFILSLIIINALLYILIASFFTYKLTLLNSSEDLIYIEKAISQSRDIFKDFLLAFVPVLGVLITSLVTLSKPHPRN